jgi:hypothetical protein
MATSTFRNKNMVRPKKTGAKKRNIQKAQKRRLIALGVAEETVEKMSPKQIKEMLKYPKKAVVA